MRYYRSRFSSAFSLLKQYKYPEPFHIAAKNFFKQNKKYGSKDRKAISEICYTYLRCGLTFSEMSLEEGLLLSGLLIDFDSEEYWNKQSEELGYKHRLGEGFFDQDASFDFIEQAVGRSIEFYPSEVLMSDFEHYNYAANLKFRPRNWAKDHTDDEPRNLGVIGTRELALNQTLDATTQVQDLSSQFICSKIDLNDNSRVWDVCSGAGGKTLNLSAEHRADFYLTDVRPGILENAKSRFNSMHYDAHYGVADLSKPLNKLQFKGMKVEQEYFDVIIADVPCTGSGTWFRTPEHFTRFPYTKLDDYVQRQKDIVKNAIPFLAKGGKFYYITCSVFRRENQEVRDWIEENTSLKMNQEILFDGIMQKADGMYMAEFS